jgi:hypothetical protein
MQLDEIISKAIPYENSDCKRVRAKKEYRREELKKQINAYLLQEIKEYLLHIEPLIRFDPISAPTECNIIL